MPIDENVLETMRLLARAPAPLPTTSKFGAKLHSHIERRVQRWVPLVEKYARAHDIDPELVTAVLRQESQGKVGAKSKTGVRGLMQVSRDTFQAFGPKGASRTNPEASVAAGTAYLAHLLDKYQGDAVRALAHYNSGGAAGRNPLKARKQGREYVEKILNIDLKKDFVPGKFQAEPFPEPAQPEPVEPARISALPWRIKDTDLL
jgi:soluble lytic murein transglycosylase-like protein